MITISINGAQYTGFLTAELICDFETISGEFTLTASAAPGVPFPVKVQDTITIYVDGTPRLIGFVDAINVTYDASSHQLTIRGRDKTSDVIDSTLGTLATLGSPITLNQIAQKVLSVLGISNITVTTIPSIAAFTEAEIVAAEVGQSAFEFIELYCRKRQVLATTDGKGNIVFTQASQTPILTRLFNVPGVGCNILYGSVDYDWQARYNSYICLSQGNISAEVNPTITDQGPNLSYYSGTATDGAVRKTRQYNFIAENSSFGADCQKRATWEANWQRTQSFRYMVTVEGNTAVEDGIVWQPNLLVNVNDQFCNISAQLLISRVTYNYSVDGGSTTMLELVTKDAYTLAATRPVTVSTKSNNQGDDFHFPVEDSST